MEFNLSTFILEIINFLILVWILQRFLYKPVLAVIAKRKESIDASLADAQNLRDEAETLQKKYANRLTHWAQEKKIALETLHLEVEKERSSRMKQLQQQLDEEQKKTQVIAERHLKETQVRSEKLAMQQGARFASLLLKRAAGPELENRLFDLLMNDLNSLSADRIQSLKITSGDVPDCIRVSSVYQLEKSKRKKLEQALNELVNFSTDYDYQLEPGLIAGFRISIGPWVLQANVQNELSGFVEISNVTE